MPSESDKWGWKHVSVFGGFDKGSGTKRWKCNHCNLPYNGSYSRVRAHLLGFTGVGVKSCSAIDRSLRKAFQILEEERLASKGNKISGSEKSSKRAKTSQLCLSSPIRTLAKEDVDDTVARFLYAEGLNANVVNSHYFQEMAKALADFGPGYENPSVDSLNDAFLKKEKSRIEKAITLVKESWTHTGCTILCVNRLDGLIGCFCINFFVSSPRGVMFLKEVDMNDGCGSDGGLIIALTDVILEAGPTNVLQVITHLGRFSRGFESVTEARFPHIFWSHCTSHSINLLMEEIAELDWMKAVVSCARGIDQLISTYKRSSSCRVIDTKKECSDPLSLKFAPSYALVKRIFETKQALQEEVVGEEWEQWKLATPEDVSSIEAVIFGDDFWGRAHLMLQLCEPFMRLLATFDIKKSIMGDVYYWWVQSLEAVRSRGIDEVTVNQLELLAENRWDVLFSPLHAAGYILNPRYFGRGQSKKKTLMRGWKATVERYESDSATRLLLREQLSAYWRLQGSLGEADAMECRDKMDPVAWWENFGFETPNLQTLAIKILSQVSCVDVCRESWQCDNLPCQEAIKRSAVERGEDIEDLVFVRNNLRLQSQKL